jgi:hypothetical protein
LAVASAGNGIADAQGRQLPRDGLVRWTNVRQAGDVKRDRQFDRWRFVQILQLHRYLSGEAARCSQGDWNGDGRFDPMDVVLASQAGGNWKGPI